MYYGSKYWRYRYDGPRDKWPEGQPMDGNLNLGTNAGYGLKEDEQYARFLLRGELGLKRLPKGVQFTPRTG